MGSGAAATISLATIDKTTLCGGMGYQGNTLETLDRRIDAAVVPLLFIIVHVCQCQCNAANHDIQWNLRKGKSTSQLQSLANELSNLFTLLQITSIDAIQDYLNAVDIASTIWNFVLSKEWTTNFPSSRVDTRCLGARLAGHIVPMNFHFHDGGDVVG